MYVKRNLEDTIRKYLPKPEIIAVTGPRQSGKTTLLQEVLKSLKHAVFVDFEDRDLLNLFNNDIKGFYNLYARDADYLIIDEFQYAIEGGQKLKYLFDTHRLKIIISGSSVLDLTHQALRYLVGRILVFHLPVFTFQEYLSYRDSQLFENAYAGIHNEVERYISGKRKKPPELTEPLLQRLVKHYREYALYGGYPRVVLAEDPEEKVVILRNIYNTYLLREVRDILQLSTEKELQKLVRALALQTGSMIVYNELGQVSGLDYTRLMKHMDILEKTFVVQRIPPFYTNKRTEIAKTPKVYFRDNGFRNMVINNFQSLEQRTDRGALNENFVAARFLQKGLEIRYWRTKSKAEVDFVLETEGRRVAVEVKSALVSPKIGRALHHFRDKYPLDRILVCSEAYSSYDKERGIAFLPLALL